MYVEEECLKGIVHPKFKVSPILPRTTMLMEALMTFSNQHNHQGDSQRERSQPSANTMEADGSHVLKY